MNQPVGIEDSGYTLKLGSEKKRNRKLEISPMTCVFSATPHGRGSCCAPLVRSLFHYLAGTGDQSLRVFRGVRDGHSFHRFRTVHRSWKKITWFSINMLHSVHNLAFSEYLMSPERWCFSHSFWHIYTLSTEIETSIWTSRRLDQFMSTLFGAFTATKSILQACNVAPGGHAAPYLMIAGGQSRWLKYSKTSIQITL